MTFSHHIPCLSCGSSDARAVYSDGSEYCFSCSTSSKGTLAGRMASKVVKEVKVSATMATVKSLPKTANEWLDKYHLTDNEKSLFSWSSEKEALIYKTYGFWNGRVFSEDGTRYTSSGMKPYEVLGSGETLVFVEDIISGIKVSRHTAVCVLFGSSIPRDVLTKYSKLYKELIIWLDYDKINASVIYSSEVRSWGRDCRSILSKLDPKMYSDEEILKFLTGR